MKEFIYKHWLLVAGGIFLTGIAMDLGVHFTGIYLFEATESFMDYIFAAIVSIALISFSIIALISGLLQNKFYGYKLSEILSFKSLGKRINLKRYIVVSLIYIIVGSLLLAAFSEVSCVNSLLMLMVSAAFSSGCIAYYVFDLMVNDESVYRSIEEGYEALVSNPDVTNKQLNYHINTIANEMNEAVARCDLEEKEVLCGLLSVLLKVVTSKKKDWNSITYFESSLGKCGLKISEEFGYQEMLKDINRIFTDCQEWDYLKADIYNRPLNEITFYDDKKLYEIDYTNQILEIELMEDYKDGKISSSDWQNIMSQFLKAIAENNVCSMAIKKKIINKYLAKLTNLYAAKNDEVLTQEECAVLYILRDRVLTSEVDEDIRIYIFERLIRNIATNNVYRKSEDYNIFLSIFFEAFYAYTYKELAVRSREYRENIRNLFQHEITDSMVSRLKASRILEGNISGVLEAFKKRIPVDVAQAGNFEAYPDFIMAKQLVWSEEFNILFFMILYCLYYKEGIGIYAPTSYLDWNNYSGSVKKSILRYILELYDLNTGTFKHSFVNECEMAGELFERMLEMGDSEQENLFKFIQAELEKVVDEEIHDTDTEDNNSLDKNKIVKCLNKKMQRENVFGWNPELDTDFYIKYQTVQGSCRESNFEEEVADMLKYCAISALNGFIKDRGNCVKLSYDEKGMEEMVEYLKEITFDVKNYSYSADWALGKYYESKVYKELADLDHKIELCMMPSIQEHIFTYKDKFSFKVVLSRISKRRLTNKECASYAEGFKKYREFYYINGVLFNKANAIEYIKKRYYIYECTFKLYLGFSKDDVVYFVHA